jgi:hypothetical protein
MRSFATLSAAAVLASLLGCAAVYPELGTRTRTIAAGVQLDPGPPGDVRWMKFLSGRVPEKTRDGRRWQSSGDQADSYAKLLVNGKELFRTPVHANTLTPTWPDGPKGNFKLGSDDRLRVEFWDSNPLSDKPIGVRDVGRPTDDHLMEKRIRVEFDSGAEVVLAFEPARAVMGLGLWYELRTGGCGITRMLDGSPAQRAGLLPGDEVLKIAGKATSALTSDEVKSMFNAVPLDGLTLVVKHPDGSVMNNVLVKEGPIYPLFSQFGPIE